ncbi:MAG: Hsp70 family protein [Acidimicrobiales bacterium]
MESDYWLGIDLGTMFTTAAMHRDGRTEIVQLGEDRAQMPSVVHISAWGELSVGDAAERRAVTDPQGVMRAFKGRLGDDVGSLVRDQMWSAEALLAALLQHVMNLVTSTVGTAPRSVALTYSPAWGPYKQDRLRAAARLAKLGQVHLVAEPVAVALRYAESPSDGRRHSGFTTTSLVLDLGGSSGSVSMVQVEPQLARAADGASSLAYTSPVPILGAVAGIEVGGADLDESLRGVVERLIGRSLVSFDDSHAATRAGLSQLRVELVAAKEQLSEQTSVELPLPLADLPPSVRVTRAEFEQAIRSHIAEAVGVVSRAQFTSSAAEPPLARMGTDTLNGAGLLTRSVTSLPMTGGWEHRCGGDTLLATDSSSVGVIGPPNGAATQILLAGGSARVPLLSHLLAQELGLPVVMDADPKAAVACGAAMFAARNERAQVGATARGNTPSGTLVRAEPSPKARSGGTDAVAVRSASGASAERSQRTSRPRLRPHPRRLGLLATAMLAVMVMMVGGFALRPRAGSPTLAGADEPLTVARYASPVMQFADQFVEARLWTLHVAEQRLVGTVTVSNNGTTPGSRRVEEIFPSTLVEDLGAIEFTPIPDRLDQSNLSVSYHVSDLAPGAATSFSYSLPVSVEAAEAQHRLGQWGRDRDRLAAVRTTEPAVSLQSLSFEQSAIELDAGSVVTLMLAGVLTDGRPADLTILSGTAVVSGEPSVIRATALTGGAVELHGRRAGRSVVVAQSGAVRASVSVTVREPALDGTANGSADGSAERAGAGTAADQPRSVGSTGSASLSGGRVSTGASTATTPNSGTAASSNDTGQAASRAPVGRTGVRAAPPAKTSPTPGPTAAPTTTTDPGPDALPPAEVPTTTTPPTTGPPPTDPPPPTTLPAPTTTVAPTDPPADPPATTLPPADPPADPPATTVPPADPPTLDPPPAL